VDQTLTELLDKGAELVVHNPGVFAYVKTGGPDGMVLEISKEGFETNREQMDSVAG
jgi:hypothetical protein